jgi:hypothetical protein
MAIEEPPNRAWRKSLAVPPLQMAGNLRQRNVVRLGNQPKNLRGMRFDALGALVATLRPRRVAARIAPPANPLHGCGRRNPEPIRRSTPAHATRNGFDQSLTKIARQRFGHVGWPPLPAHSMNHCSQLL